MENEQFSLCWNNFHSNLSSGFHALLRDEDLVDVTLAAEGKYLKAHKTVLSVCSPYFKELFRANPCDHPIVILHDVKYNALQNLLEFMYQGEVSVSQEEIPTFMRVADVLKIKGLSENATNAGTNGLDTNYTYESNHSSDAKQYLKRKQGAASVKKIIKPVQQLKPVDYGRSIKSPPPARSPATPQSPAKQPRLENSITVESGSGMVITPKIEPADSEDDFRGDPYDDPMDMSSMLDTTLGEPSEYKANCSSVGSSSKQSMDTSSPGTLQCVMGKRGNPRLVVDGYSFFKKSSYKTKGFWYCKFNRNPEYRCPATCWTQHGKIVKWPSRHSHPPISDFNPEEDRLVPVDQLRDVLIKATLT